jgi:hypothetical protein
MDNGHLETALMAPAEDAAEELLRVMAGTAG